MKWVLSNLDTISDATLAHLAIAIPPIFIAFLLSIPVGWLVVRLQRPGGSRVAAGVGTGIVTVAGLLYAIPSLALFVALPAVIGTGLQDPVNLIISLTLYGLALMVRSTVDALTSVDAGTKAAATAMGYSGLQRFFRVELPLAGPVLLAGLRVVAVSTISLTTVGAVLGIQSLGSLFTDGLGRGIYEEILSGIVMVLVLAFALDGLLVLLGRLVMPWTRRAPRSRRAVRRVLQRAEVAS
ncbi:ABC transporter permease [Curtobacterium citreum]|uniref:ABC transporter permease subunit n=1 Tax=Curtobacterium citreum TaxID=2036 RepID=A0ABT2HJI7_9MICO|nr:ABC transporter permease subunit [Curtobacterium citreum]MCS6523440.1 ABC transporter permease subunit [Curtobacterium citreum]TQJ27706.1 osmoprotectant transport system permease protein [Curtobacterium citreum]GGL84289.1 ABC transporter permease [Curtobacterium citreum]